MKLHNYCKLIIAFATVSSVFIDKTSAIKTMDVQPYIDELEERLQSLAKAQPSQEIVEAFVQELQASCKTNRTIDMSMMQNMSSCMENLFNQTNLVAEFQEAVPKGDLDVVFRNLCLKWPEMKSCMQEGFEVIGECWGQNVESQMLRGMDTFVGFFCGEDNDGARVALFIAEDGIKCLDSYGSAIGECMTDQASENHVHDLCGVLLHLDQCIPILKKCTNVTPENLITSVVHYVGKVIGCPPFPVPTYVYPSESAPTLVDSIKIFRNSINKLMDDNLYMLNFNEGLVKFVTNCEMKGVTVDIDGLKNVTKNCKGLDISPNHITDFQHMQISTICSKLVRAAECLKPYRSLESLRNCTGEEFVVLTLAEELCKNNGTWIYGSLYKLGLECFQRRSTWSIFRKCAEPYNSEFDLENTLDSKSTPSDFCRTLTLMKKCGITAMTKCGNPETVTLFTEFLNTVEHKNTDVQKCLDKPLQLRNGSVSGFQPCDTMLKYFIVLFFSSILFIYSLLT